MNWRHFESIWNIYRCKECKDPIMSGRFKIIEDGKMYLCDGCYYGIADGSTPQKTRDQYGIEEHSCAFTPFRGEIPNTGKRQCLQCGRVCESIPNPNYKP